MRLHRVIVITILASILAACGRPETGDEEAVAAENPEINLRAPTVDILLLQPQRLASAQEFPGRIQPVHTAQVRARVSGLVKRRMFDEGSTVQAGQPLYEIESASYEVAVERADAVVQRSRVMVDDAQVTVDRYGPLAEIGAVSKQNMLTAQTALNAAKASLALAQAELKQTRLDLDYATVRAPIDGYIGRSLITEGQLVGKDEATILATIQQIDIVYADVTQPISDLVKIRARTGLSEKPRNAEPQCQRVTARIEGTSTTREGRLLFFEKSVDPSSGKVTLRSQFNNQDGLLLPGMYVRISIDDDSVTEELAVPQRAVRFDAKGVASVLIVSDAGKVEERPVETGDMYGNLWQITRGLAAGDRVIVDGPDIVEGQIVKVGKSLVTSDKPAPSDAKGS